LSSRKFPTKKKKGEGNKVAFVFPNRKKAVVFFFFYSILSLLFSYFLSVENSDWFQFEEKKKKKKNCMDLLLLWADFQRHPADPVYTYYTVC
jgi:hypothetical protein